MRITAKNVELVFGSVKLWPVPGDEEMVNLFDETGGQSFAVSTIERAFKALLSGVREGVEWNAAIEAAAALAYCADPKDGRDHGECPFCSLATDILALKK